MAVLYTHGDFITLAPADFAAYSQIRYSKDDPTHAVGLGLALSGTVNLAAQLGSVAAEVDGAQGADAITTGSGNDQLWGNAGDDTLYGGAGDDMVAGDWNDHKVTGNDVLYGGDGSDGLVGGLGNDTLYGGAGNDILFIAEDTPGNDSFFGGAGNDVLYVRDLFITGLLNPVFNRLVLDAAASVEHFVTDGTFVFGTAGDDLFNLTGTESGTLTGDILTQGGSFNLQTGADTFLGGISGETVTLSDGHDLVKLGAGNDRLIIEDGILDGDQLFGGDGQDSLDAAFMTGQTVHILDLSASASFETVSLGAAILTGTAGDDRWDLSGVSSLSTGTMQMAAGNDLLLGSGSTDYAQGEAGNDTLYGGVGSDFLDGGSGANQIYGGADDDYLTSGEADAPSVAATDALYGGDGSDDLKLYDWQPGLDIVSGGTGNDRLQLGHFDTVLRPMITFSDAGLATFKAAGLERLIVGNDIILTGSAKADTVNLAGWAQVLTFNAIDLLAGNDSFVAAAGGANVNGGAGNDTLTGSGADDTLIGGAGIDLMTGGNGSDTYEVDQAGDVVVETGSVGRDTLMTSLAVWTLDARFENLTAEGSGGLNGTGNAVGNALTGAGGNDRLTGLGGNDTLTGGGGSDTLSGGAGNDTYVLGDGLAQVVELAGGGRDTVNTSAATCTLAAQIENLTSTGLGNFLGIGNDAGNAMKGGLGNDTLRGLAGNDTLSAGRGQDVLEGGKGNDVYNIGLYGDGTASILELAGGGKDRVEVWNGSATLADFVETLTLHGGETDGHGVPLAYVGTGNGFGNLMVILDHKATLLGLGGADTLTGATGADRLEGGDGNDRLDGGLDGVAVDTLIGGAGDDTYVIHDPDQSLWHINGIKDVIVEAADGGTDMLELNSARVFLDSENIEGLRDLYQGGTDKAWGSHVQGNDASNTLITGNSRDQLWSGLGNDTLTGNAGADRFVFTTAAGPGNVDTITDFEHLSDRLDFYGAGCTYYLPMINGHLTPDAFRVVYSVGEADATDRVLYQPTTGEVFLDSDGPGLGGFTLVAILSSRPVLTAADIEYNFIMF